MYQLRETVFDKRNPFKIPYLDDKNLFKDIAIFNTGSICVHVDKIRDTDTTTWVGKYDPICASILSNLTLQSIFLCNSHRATLIESFIDALDRLATQNEALKSSKTLEIKTSVKIKLNQIFSALNKRRCRNEPVLDFENRCIEEEKEQEVSTQVLKTQKINSLICTITRKDIATFFQSLAPTVQKTTII